MMPCFPTIRSLRFGMSIHEDILAALDPLARSALVLRGIQHFSIPDCALLLDMPRQNCRGCVLPGSPLE